MQVVVDPYEQSDNFDVAMLRIICAVTCCRLLVQAEG